MVKKSKYVQTMIMFILAATLSFSNNVYAINLNENPTAYIEINIDEFIDNIARSEMFYDWTDADVIVNDIYSYTKNDLKVYKLGVMKNDMQLGYILSDEAGNILSYSRNSEPEEFMKDYCNMYTGIESDNYNSEPESVCAYSGIQTYSSPYMVIDGVSPQLQGKNINCIVAAASNVIWYYGNNGHLSLIKNYTFSDVQT